MSNKFNWEDESFSDIPDEVNEQTPEIPRVAVKKQAKAQAKPKSAPVVKKPEPEVQVEEQVTEEEYDFESSLNDARLRLEKGRLYEMLMKHDLFEGVDADPVAIKQVQSEMRSFAKECMEVMLGMKSIKPKAAQAESSLFNELEIQAIKALASAATKGATEQVEVAKKQGLNPISSSGRVSQPKPLSSTAKQPVSRKKADQEAIIEQILAEEGITREEYDAQYPPDYKPLEKPIELLTPEEILQRNARVKAKTQVKSNMAIPMPSETDIERMVMERAASAAANPQMNLIMAALNKSNKKS